MYNVHIHHIVFELYMTKKQKSKKNKGDEKIEIFTFGFLNFEKGWWNLQTGFSQRIAKGCSL